MSTNRSISCGQEIPEGRQVCIACEMGVSPTILQAKKLSHCRRKESTLIPFPAKESNENSIYNISEKDGINSHVADESVRWKRDRDTLLIVGAGGFGRVVLEYAEKDFICAFIDDNMPVGSEVDGVKVIGKISDIPRFKEYTNLIVAIGDNYVRERVYTMTSKFGFVFPNIIADSAFISTKASIGNGCIILNNVVIQSGALAGNGLILHPGVELHNDSFVDDYALIYTNSVIRSEARVGKRAWIGSTVTVSTCEKVADDAVINDQWLKVKPKTFEELWGEIIATNKLPEMAMVVMHESFSKETKNLLVSSKMSGNDIADLLNQVIFAINHGSVQKVDDLVRYELKKRFH